MAFMSLNKIVSPRKETGSHLPERMHVVVCRHVLSCLTPCTCALAEKYGCESGPGRGGRGPCLAAAASQVITGDSRL